MMKSLLTMTMLCILSSSTAAQSDFSITWSVNGIEEVESITLDFDQGTNYIAAKGSYSFAGGGQTIVDGACFEGSSGSVHCNLHAPLGRTISLEIQLPSLNGSWRKVNVSGAVLEQGSITMTKVE